MKINIVIPSTVLGGGIRVVFIYANYLINRGHDICVYLPGIYCWDDIGKLNIKTSISNGILRRNKLKWFDNKFQIKVVPIIKDRFIRNADVTIATAWFTAGNVYHLSGSKGKKVYFIQDYEIWNQNKTIVDNTYKRNMTRITITKTLRDTIRSQCGVDSYVIYNGHSSNEYIIGEKKLNNPKNVIMLGNFAEYKGGKIGLDILKNMHEKYKIRIIIFGALKCKNIPKYAEFYQAPKRSVLISLFQKADICLFPSKVEAWGLTVIEAMANKAAVVGFSTGCLKEIGMNEENALIVKNLDESKLELALERLIKNEDLLVKLQNAGFKSVQDLKWENAGERFERYLEKLVSCEQGENI